MANKMIQHQIPPTPDSAALGVTYVGGAATALFWGLKVSDLCMMLSTLATLMGLGLQIFLATRRLRRLEHRQEKVAHVATTVTHRLKAHVAKDETDEGTSDGG